MYCGVESAAVRPGVCRVRAWTPRQTKTEPAFFAAGPAVHPALARSLVQAVAHTLTRD